ncbi:MAG: aldehyde ferredoxin oxidoreductase C-terminal domain-containing protein [Thermodesulfobacteriota bacterium]|nr:aldehyde ferredoxin oxidoreductase C-terminal domain-containing protein [Thermodesulfobacteriota bacterium]
MGKILRINMSDMAFKTDELGEYAGLGGRALTSSIIDKEVPPLCHPLGLNNKLVVSPGLLTGTIAASSGRCHFGCKSPLTGGIKEGNSGGVVAQKIARLGYSAIVLEGKPEDDKLRMVFISKDKAEILPADEYKGLGNYETVERIREKYGKVGIISIGPAGEQKLNAASIAVNDMDNKPTRHAGRGGQGAVMGSKGIKAIVVDDAGGPGVEIKDKDEFKKWSKIFTDGLLKHPVTGEGLPTYGTAVLVNIINEAGGFPTRNFSSGNFENAAKISGEQLTKNCQERQGKETHPCSPGCVIRCSNVYNDKDGNYLTSGLEYETIWAFGANCDIDNLDTIAKFDYLCDDIGLDTIETGGTLAVAMEGGLLPFGDWDRAIKILDQDIRNATPIGKIIGSGAVVTGRVLGVTRVPAVKGQNMPAYDPRAIQGIGVTYATSTMGADHTAGYAIATNIMKVGGYVDPLKTEGQVELSRNLQIASAALDSTGLCLFTAFPVLDQPETFEAIYRMLNAQYGLSLTADDVTELGKNVLKTERNFNIKAGFTNKDDRLPEFMYQEALAPHNNVFMVKDEEIDEFWNF